MAISPKLNRIPAKLTIIGRVKESFFTVECHELYINPDGRRVASVDTLSIVAVRLLVVNYTEGDYRRDDLS